MEMKTHRLGKEDLSGLWLGEVKEEDLFGSDEDEPGRIVLIDDPFESDPIDLDDDLFEPTSIALGDDLFEPTSIALGDDLFESDPVDLGENPFEPDPIDLDENPFEPDPITLDDDLFEPAPIDLDENSFDPEPAEQTEDRPVPAVPAKRPRSDKPRKRRPKTQKDFTETELLGDDSGLRLDESDVRRVLRDPVISAGDETNFRRAIADKISQLAKSLNWRNQRLPLVDRVPTTQDAKSVTESPVDVVFSSFEYDQSMMHESGHYSVEDDPDCFDVPADRRPRIKVTRFAVPCVNGSKCASAQVTHEVPGKPFVMMAYWAPDEKEPPSEVLKTRQCLLCHRFVSFLFP